MKNLILIFVLAVVFSTIASTIPTNRKRDSAFELFKGKSSSASLLTKRQAQCDDQNNVQCGNGCCPIGGACDKTTNLCNYLCFPNDIPCGYNGCCLPTETCEPFLTLKINSCVM
ncbi:hypothetical protein GLOIN_2v1704946 [Rhizophagus clarus]|uniref:Granulins domain-containing protein n=1 Tax=Rhizophagus clarus TaxID=94130 RepID=A0A8H3L6M0_9GLOM|nr:hypothetical protein GLOIN_2v1704946 [Rhizophagus clarus]